MERAHRRQLFRYRALVALHAGPSWSPLATAGRAPLWPAGLATVVALLTVAVSLVPWAPDVADVRVVSSSPDVLRVVARRTIDVPEGGRIELHEASGRLPCTAVVSRAVSGIRLDIRLAQPLPSRCRGATTARVPAGTTTLWRRMFTAS